MAQHSLTAAAAVAIGGKPWTGRNGTERVYINPDAWAPLVDLQVTYYKSGNVSGATLGGADISNAEAGRLLDTQVYVQNDTLHVRTGSRWTSADDIAQAILSAAANTQAA